MSRTHEDLDLDLITVEGQLLQEVCELVRSWQGRPPVAALDVVLSGARRPAACSSGPRSRAAATRRWRPGSSSASGRRVDGSV